MERPPGTGAPNVSGRPAGTPRTLLAERGAAVLCVLVATWLGVRAESFVTQSSIARPGALPPHAVIWLGAAVLGWLADQTSIRFVYQVCSFLPAIGLLTAFLPKLEGQRTAAGAGPPTLAPEAASSTTAAGSTSTVSARAGSR